MSPNPTFGLRVLLWSLSLTLIQDHFAGYLNPFLASVILLLTVLAVLIQLFLLRKKGVAYVALFLLCLVVLTYIFMYIDHAIFAFPRRYYSPR